MSEIIDFLTSPQGQEITHAFVILLVAIAGYITFLTRQNVQQNQDKLNAHLQLHIREAIQRGENPDAENQ